MNKNEYKVNTYVLIKNGEFYEIDDGRIVEDTNRLVKHEEKSYEEA